MGELWIPLLSSKSFFIVLIAQKKIQCPQLKQPRKHLHTRSRLLVPHSQPASPKWRPTPEITWHHDQSPWEWSIKPSRVISTKNNTTSMCSPSWNAMKTHLCSSRSSCCCWSNDCFESYTERELLWKIAHFRNFGDSSEIVSVMSWGYTDCGKLN